MDIRHRIDPEDADALSVAIAASGQRDATLLTTGFVSLAALTLAMPFSASNEGVIRLLAALALALGANWAAVRIIHWWRDMRTRWVPLPTVMGLEPGERVLSIALESVRETTVEGERVFRWRSFLDCAETENWLALRVSDRECLVIPRSALKMRALSEAEGLMALVGRGGR